jgi:hypothetical protein
MAMQAATLEILEKADLPPRQARAIAQAIELEVSAGHTRLVTREDLLEVKHEIQVLKQDFRANIADSKSEIVRWVFLCILGQSAMLLGIGYFLFNHITA